MGRHSNHLFDLIRLEANRPNLQDALLAGDLRATAGELAPAMVAEQLDFLTLTDASGRVIQRAGNPAVAGVDVTTEYFQFGGTAFFPGEQWAVPFLSLTIGATRYSADQGYDSDTKFSGSLGGGLRLPFNDNFAATLGVRGYLTLVESDTSIFCKSDSEGGGCLVRSSGSTFFQAEATLGLTVRF